MSDVRLFPYRVGASRSPHGWAWPLLGLAIALGPLTLAAQTSAPIPALSNERVYVLGVQDEFGSLRDEIARLERTSPQTYYVVILRSAGPGRRATRDYIETLVARWQEQARQGHVRFDRQRAVIIVVDLENRRIIVLGGPELQERYGFRDPYIERDLLEPHFYPFAKAGDYARGLRVLVGQIDRWIAERDRELTRRRQEMAAREARLRGDAQAALKAGRTLRDEARRELDARQAAGLKLEALEVRFRDASGDLDAAARRLDTSAPEALDLAQRGQRVLQEVLDQLRRISARQAELDDRLEAESTRAAEVLEAIEAAGRAGLPVAPVQRDLDAANGLIEQARQAIRTEPDRAADLLAQIERQLRDIRAHVQSLPDLRRQVSEEAAAIGSLERAARAEFERARGAGVVDAALAKDWAEAQERLATARRQAETELRQAVAGFDTAERSLRSIRDRAAEATRRHRYRTRTLPAMILGIAVAAVGAILGWLWYRRRRAQETLDARFQGFRAHAVGLMDRLDALRERHRTLTAADPDYTAPMTGATLALYQSIESDLNRLWDRWLRVMEAWEKAQAMARTGSTFGTKEFEEARKLLEREGNFEEITREVESCRERLDRLNQGHEQAHEALRAVTDECARFRTMLDALRAAGLPPAAYLDEFGPLESLATQAGTIATADPIGAGEALAKAREALAALARRIEQVQAGLRRAEEVRRLIEDVTVRAAKLRSGGLLLAEEAGNPDPRLDQARRLVDASLESLKEANPGAASELLDQAQSAVDAANAGIDRHLEARDAFAGERAARQQAAAHLEESARQAARLVEDLQSHFARPSWQDVAGHLDQVRAELDAARERLTRADRAASDEVQGFVQASTLLSEAAERHAKAEQLLASLAERHAALTALAEQVRDQVRGLESEFNQVARSFEQNRAAIGPEAERSRAEAEQAYRALVDALGGAQPDWPDLRARAASLRRGLEVALKQAEADIEGYRRTTERLEQVRRRGRQVETLLRREEKDRPPANQRYRAAAQALVEFERDARIDPGSWDRQLRRLDEIAANLDRAEALAGQDIRLANAATAEIAEAARVIREARAFYQSGIAVDVSQAEAQLNRARGALATQAYEQAIDLANAAEHLAREAFDRAAYEARRRGMTAERGRAFHVPDVLVIAAAQAVAQIAGRWMESIPAAGTPGPRVGGSDPAGGSWGTDAPSGSWTSGADEGRW